MNTYNFLHELFDPQGQNHLSVGRIAVSGLVPTNGTKNPWKTKHIQSVVKAAREIELFDVDCSATFFGCGLREEGLKTPQRGGIKHVIGIPGLWSDIDIRGPAHTNPLLPPDLASAITIIESVGVEPTIIVNSGYGLHAWWLFENGPWIFKDTHDRQKAIKLLHALQVRTQKTASDMGYRVDSTDLSRVLRAPGTTNRKLAEHKIVTGSLVGERISFSKIYSLLNLSNDEVRVAQVPTEFSTSFKSREDLPFENSVGTANKAIQIPAITNIDEVKSRLARSDNQHVTMVLAGEPFAEPGTRDFTMQHLASVMSFMCPGAAPEMHLEILRPSLLAMAKRDEGLGTDVLGEDWALDKLRRAKEYAITHIEHELDLKNGLSDPPPPEDTLFTEDDIKEMAAEHGCSIDEFSKRWAIQKDNSYFVIGPNKKYLAPISKHELEVSIPRDWKRFDIQWFTFPANGPPKKRTVKSVVDEHGTLARHLVSDMTLESSWYSAIDQTFYEAVCPVDKHIKPQEHVEIDTWLSLLGGSYINKLLDWLATVTNLNWQSCALYLHGVAGSGKTMLADGLARIWRSAAPTPMESVVSGFNSSLSSCPLVFADERLPTINGKKMSSAQVREFIGTTSRKFKRKFLPESTLFGAIRLMLASNSDNLLELDEDIGKKDINAIASRFLSIEVTDKAVNYLNSLGGRQGTEGWIDKIAEHVLWLRDTREVSPGSRFLVEGNARDIGRGIIVQGRVPSQVAEWLACYLLQPVPAVSRYMRVGNGEYWASVKAISAAWQNFIKSDNVPNNTRLGRVLRTLGLDYARRGVSKIHMHRIDMDILCAWAERSGFIDPDDIKKAVNKPVLESIAQSTENEAIEDVEE